MRLVQGIGMQKSGTTILRKIFENIGANVIPREQQNIWGHEPPFSPTGYPVGTLYQKHGDTRGHVLDASDVDEEMAIKMQSHFLHKTGWCYGKSPYGTVRIPFIKELYPDSVIVASVRNPIANVYSIYKKFNSSDGGVENGWWGVKPANWKELIREDSVEQLALLWRDVNQHVLDDIDMVDFVLPYHELCTNPSLYVNQIISYVEGADVTTDINRYPKIGFFDDEYKKGASVVSRNQSEARVLNSKEFVEPFTDEQVKMVEDICMPLYNKLIA